MGELKPPERRSVSRGGRCRTLALNQNPIRTTPPKFEDNRDGQHDGATPGKHCNAYLQPNG